MFRPGARRRRIRAPVVTYEAARVVPVEDTGVDPVRALLDFEGRGLDDPSRHEGAGFAVRRRTSTKMTPCAGRHGARGFMYSTRLAPWRIIPRPSRMPTTSLAVRERLPSPTVSSDVMCTPSATGRMYGSPWSVFGPVAVDVAADAGMNEGDGPGTGPIQGRARRVGVRDGGGVRSGARPISSLVVVGLSRCTRPISTAGERIVGLAFLRTSPGLRTPTRLRQDSSSASCDDQPGCSLHRGPRPRFRS